MSVTRTRISALFASRSLWILRCHRRVLISDIAPVPFCGAAAVSQSYGEVNKKADKLVRTKEICMRGKNTRIHTTPGLL